MIVKDSDVYFFLIAFSIALIASVYFIASSGGADANV